MYKWVLEDAPAAVSYFWSIVSCAGTVEYEILVCELDSISFKCAIFIGCQNVLFMQLQE